MASQQTTETTSSDELCPLLYGTLEAQQPAPVLPTPLPKAPLFALCVLRLVEP
jgi:hypothetical protein